MLYVRSSLVIRLAYVFVFVLVLHSDAVNTDPELDCGIPTCKTWSSFRLGNAHTDFSKPQKTVRDS